MHVHKCYHTVFGKSHAIHLAIVVVSSNRTRWRWKTSSFESTRNKAVGALLVFKLARPKQEKVQYVLDYRLASKLKAEKTGSPKIAAWSMTLLCVIQSVAYMHVYIYVFWQFTCHILPKGLQSGPPPTLIKVLIQGSLLLQGASINLLDGTSPPPRCNKWFSSRHRN
jgi:hypothetical protein